MAVDKPEKVGGITFFAEFERHPKGGFKSERPAWYDSHLLDELKEELKGKEKVLAMKGFNLPNEEEVRQQAKDLKNRINEIEASRPKWNDKQKDELMGVARELEGHIRDAMYSRSEMNLGLASGEGELRRSMQPAIPVSPELAREAGVAVYVKGKTNRDGAIKIRNFIMRGVDPDAETNPEYLRREKLNGVEHTQRG